MVRFTFSIMEFEICEFVTILTSLHEIGFFNKKKL